MSDMVNIGFCVVDDKYNKISFENHNQDLIELDLAKTILLSRTNKGNYSQLK